MNPTRKLVGGIALTLALTSIQQATADAINPVLDDKFTFKGGAIINDLSGTLTVTRPPLPETPIDLDNLDLDNQTQPWLAFRWRFADKWSLNFMYNRYDSQNSATIEREFNYDGVTYPVGAGVSTSLTANAYIMDVSYSLYKTERAEFGLGLGLHAFDLSAELQGFITIDDMEETFESGNEELIAPVPNLRLYGIYAFGPKTSVKLDGGWLSLSYEDYDGDFLYASAAFEYRFTEHFGAGVGYQYTEIELTYEPSDKKTEFDLEFNGAQLYLTYSF